MSPAKQFLSTSNPELQQHWSIPEYFFTTIVIVLCISAYSLALQGPLFFDDIPNLVNNDLLQITGTRFEEWRTAALSSSAGPLQRPVAMFTFALNYIASDAITALAIKLTNLFIHVLTAGLIYRFVLLLLGTPGLQSLRLPGKHPQRIALLAASLWLLHPLHVSTVMYGVQRMAQLSTLFTLVGLILFLFYRLRWTEQRTSAEEFVAAILWLGIPGLLAVFSKENGVVLPFLILVIEVTLFQGVWNGMRRPRLLAVSWGLLLFPLIFVALAGVIAPEIIIDRYAAREFTLEERLLTQTRVLWSYVGWLAVPSITDMGFFHDDIALSKGLFQPITTLLAMLAWLAVLYAAFYYRVRFPLLAFTAYFYLVAHSLESTIIPLEMVFEHRNYLPGISIVLLMTVGLYKGCEKLSAVNFAVVGIVVAIALAGLLAARTNAWRDDLSLAQFNVINHPESPRANFYYANALYIRNLKADSSGLSDQERKALVVSARQYFAKMYELAPTDFAGLVMMYQLDHRYFPGLAKKHDWLGVIEAQVESRRLQRSDRTALAALVSHVTSEQGISDRERVDALLVDLRNRYPKNSALVALRFRLLQSYGAERSAQLQLMLEQSAQQNPNSRKTAAYLAQFYGNENLPKTYAAIAAWLANDDSRVELSKIHGAFD